MKYTHYPKRDAIKNYFPMPNEFFNLGLRAGKIALYAFLLKCEDRIRKEIPRIYGIKK